MYSYFVFWFYLQQKERTSFVYFRMRMIVDLLQWRFYYFLNFEIKSCIILVAIRRTVSRVGGAHLRVIAPGQHIDPFEEMLQR